MCISDQSATTAGDELYDMSGNVKEWVTTESTPATAGHPAPTSCAAAPTTSPSFVDNSGDAVRDAARPGCSATRSTPAPTDPVRLPSVGFRCCHTGALPP